MRTHGDTYRSGRFRFTLPILGFCRCSLRHNSLICSNPLLGSIHWSLFGLGFRSASGSHPSDVKRLPFRPCPWWESMFPGCSKIVCPAHPKGLIAIMHGFTERLAVLSIEPVREIRRQLNVQRCAGNRAALSHVVEKRLELV